MSKLTRITQKLFGSGAGVDQIGVFGSKAAGSPAFTTDPATAMSLSNWLTGWAGAVIGGNAPTLEDMNAAMFVFAYQLAYNLQAGIGEWDSGTTYYIGSFVNVSGLAYVSRTDSNLNNDPTSDATNWKVIGGDLMTALGDITYGGTAGKWTKLTGNVDAVPKMLAQQGDGLGSSAAPAWREIKAPTIQKFTSGSGTYTLPAGVMYIKVRAVGGGGGGAGSGSSAGSAATDGGDTNFGTSLIVAGGGLHGSLNATNGGAGGSATLGSGPVGLALQGGYGGAPCSSSSGTSAGGMGGSSAFGGAGSNSGGTTVGAGTAGKANTGGGGGGASGFANPIFSGAGGGSGGFVEGLIVAPSATYAYSVGSGGTAGGAGPSGYAGAAGGSGGLIIYEYYQ